jgi:hypothetical protein
MKMEINKYISKKNLYYITIFVVILIIVRILYSIFYTNENNSIEGFNINNDAATDLLSKYKSTEAQNIVDPTNKNTEMQIYVWNNRIYNMENPTSLTKAISLYKPNLMIRDVNYAKLGDIVCQNNDYSLPKHDQFTLLIKKGTSDIKPPTRFDLMAEIINTNFNPSYYEYSNYIDNSANFSAIADNLYNCSSVISNLNALIQNNLSIIQSKFTENALESINIVLPAATFTGNNSYKMSDFLNKLRKGKYVVEGPDMGYVVKAPAGIAGYVIINGQQIDISIPSSIDSLPNSKSKLSNLSAAYENIPESSISNTLIKIKLFEYIPIKNIVTYITSLCNDIESIYNQSQSQTTNLLKYLNLAPSLANVRSIKTTFNGDNFQFSDISRSSGISSLTSSTPLLQLVLYIISTAEISCNSTIIELVILKHKTIIKQEGRVRLAEAEIDTAKSIGGLIPNHRVKTTNVGCYNDQYYNPQNGTNLEMNRAIPTRLGVTLNINISEADRVQQCADLANEFGFNTIGVQAGEYCFGGYNPDYSKHGPAANPNCNVAGDGWVNRVYKITNDSINITGYNNNFLENIPSSAYNILTNSTYDRNSISIINSILLPINNFSQFTGDFANNSIGYFPLQIYKPIAPENYTALGDVFCNITNDLQKIIDSKNVACVPSHCVKEIRDWTSNDKIFEYNKDGKYFAIYFNPYIGTFISTKTQQLPTGKVCKVVSCVKKCTVVEDLEKADDCARKYYNLNKKSITNTPLSSTLVSNQEEEFYLDKIKIQSDSITRLKQRAQQMQTDIDKATIVNSEMNKSKLQNYVDDQKRNIDIIMKRLQDDKNKIKTDVNIPSESLKDLIDMIKNSSSISSENKAILLSKIANTQNLSGAEYDNSLNQILNSCPQYDLSGLVSKQTASDVCFGCDTPK